MKFEYRSEQLTHLHHVTVWLAVVQTSVILHAMRNNRGTDWAASVVAAAADEVPPYITEPSDLAHLADEYVRAQ